MLDRSFVFMGHARDHIDIPGQADERRFHLVVPGDARSVRRAVTSAMDAIRVMELGRPVEGVVEIVLAEVLNNVVEHAYSPQHRGVIEIEAIRDEHTLVFRVTDDGRPMPDNKIPHGRLRDLDVRAEDLPEGGFGWFLIRSLTDELHYIRDANRNRLSFRIALTPVTRPS